MMPDTKLYTFDIEHTHLRHHSGSKDYDVIEILINDHTNHKYTHETRFVITRWGKVGSVGSMQISHSKSYYTAIKNKRERGYSEVYQADRSSVVDIHEYSLYHNESGRLLKSLLLNHRAKFDMEMNDQALSELVTNHLEEARKQTVSKPTTPAFDSSLDRGKHWGTW